MTALPLRSAGSARVAVTALVLALLGALVVLPQAAASPSTTFYVAVAAAGAGDEGLGTAAHPFRTLAAGLAAAERATASGTAAVVVVHPGVYRESLHLGPSVTDAPLTVEAAGPGVVVTGADEWSGWTEDSPGVWVHPWPFRWGAAAVPADWPAVEPLLRRREVVRVEGTVVRQVLDSAALGAADGTYLVDEARGRLLLRPPAGVALPSSRVEVSTRASLLTAVRRHRLTLRGLSFELAASPLQRGAVVLDGVRELTIEDARFSWNNWAGLQLLNVDGAVIRRSAANDNGVLGLAVWRSARLLFEDGESSRNNTWRGAWAGFEDWEDGSKLFSTRQVVFRRHTAVHNNGPGLWFDTDNVDVLVEDSYLAHNERFGAYAELNQGPLTFRGNRLCGNTVVGFMNVKSQDVLLERNELFGNSQEAIGFSGAPGTVHIPDFEAGALLPLRNERFTLRDNVLSQGPARLVQNNLQQPDWDHLKRTLVSEGNRWHSTHAVPFTVPGRWLALSGWRSDTGQDRTSSFEGPEQLTCTAPSWLTAPTPAPSPSEAPASPSPPPPAPAGPAPEEPTQLAPARSMSAFRGQPSTTTGGGWAEGHRLSTFGGVHTAELTLPTGDEVELEVRDAAGAVVGRAAGGSGTRWRGTLPAGASTWTVSGMRATSYRLVVTVGTAAHG